MRTQTITPFLWFDQHAEEATTFSVSVFSGAPRASGASRIVTATSFLEQA